MASDINTFSITGRMTQDARLEYTQGGMAICNGSVAVNKTTSNKATGEKKDEASFFDIKILGKFAEAMQPHMAKGQEIAASGYLKQERWQAQDGTNRSKVVLMVESMKLIGGRGAQNNSYNDGNGYNDGGNYGDASGAFSGVYGN